MNKNQFLARIIPTLLDHHVNIRIEHRRHFQNKFSGWFDGDKPEFAIANKHNCAFDVMVHEYNHFLQWIQDRPFWDKYASTATLLYDAVQHDHEVTTEMIEGNMAIEHDCEARTIEMINDLQLEIDPSLYAQNCSAHLFSFHVLQHVGGWTEESVTSIPEIVMQMPTHLHDLSYYLDPENIPTDALMRMTELCSK